MVKVVWTDATSYVFSDNLSLNINAKRTSAVYNDDDNGGKIILTGEKLKADSGDPDVVGSGIGEKVILKDAGGHELLAITGKFDAGDFGETLEASGVFDAYFSLLSGNDRIFGSQFNDSINGSTGDDEIFGGKGADTLLGGKGDDVLTGGLGVDLFAFQATDGARQDVVTDLDIVGEKVDILYFLGMDVESIRKANHGEDSLITLDSGGTVLIEGIEKADLKEYLDNLSF
mgnify:CR=1 FL=1